VVLHAGTHSMQQQIDFAGRVHAEGVNGCGCSPPNVYLFFLPYTGRYSWILPLYIMIGHA